MLTGLTVTSQASTATNAPTATGTEPPKSELPEPDDELDGEPLEPSSEPESAAPEPFCKIQHSTQKGKHFVYHALLKKSRWLPVTLANKKVTEFEIALPEGDLNEETIVATLEGGGTHPLKATWRTAMHDYSRSLVCKIVFHSMVAHNIRLP